MSDAAPEPDDDIGIYSADISINGKPMLNAGLLRAPEPDGLTIVGRVRAEGLAFETGKKVRVVIRREGAAPQGGFATITRSDWKASGPDEYGVTCELDAEDAKRITAALWAPA